jgi:hypothetical protein
MAWPVSDASPNVTSMMVAHWRETPLWQKLAYVNELNQTLKTLATSDLRRCYPMESEAQLQRRLAVRWLGVELADRIYGPINEEADATH